jgi:hypothetical protein
MLLGWNRLKKAIKDFVYDPDVYDKSEETSQRGHDSQST